MPRFTINAYQEMFAEQEIEASNLHDAVAKFTAMLKDKQVTWCPSDEDMDYTVSEEDETGRVIREVSGDALDYTVKA